MKPFLWGAATSSYQTEGAVANDWTDWEAAGRLRDAGERCGLAAGHRNRWKADFALLPSIGANAYRFSVEWSRIRGSSTRTSSGCSERACSGCKVWASSPS